MSWPSFYGYKYTPIGLRQREKKDDHSGTRSICTTVHLPQGGHLLDIERQYGMDGSMSKRETQNMDPASYVPAPAVRPSERASSPAPPSADPFEMPSLASLRNPSDFERQADDIIANFRARQGIPIEWDNLKPSDKTCPCRPYNPKIAGDIIGSRSGCTCFRHPLITEE